MIYAVAIDDHAICKIGFATDVTKRISNLQTGTPYPLRLVKVREGCRFLEKAIHRRLTHLRMRGEWFKLTPETMTIFDDTKVDEASNVRTPRMTDLLTDIRAFCEANAMPVTRFGDLAMNDTAFVNKLERGRRTWPETEAKARDFMAAYKAEKAA